MLSDWLTSMSQATLTWSGDRRVWASGSGAQKPWSNPPVFSHDTSTPLPPPLPLLPVTNASALDVPLKTHGPLAGSWPSRIVSVTNGGVANPWLS